MKLQILIPQYKETDEEWKPIIGYEGLYEVSTYGRIRSLPRKGSKGGIVKPSLSGSGYLQTHLCKDGVSKTFQIHRLVAMHFLDNANDYPEVNHIDECKTNNHVSNLEYCTRLQNVRHGTGIGRMAKAHNYKESAIKSARNHDYKEVARKQSKRVAQIGMDGKVIKIWESVREASKGMRCSSSQISNVCNEKTHTAHGFIWQFVKESGNA